VLFFLEGATMVSDYFPLLAAIGRLLHQFVYHGIFSKEQSVGPQGGWKCLSGLELRTQSLAGKEVAFIEKKAKRCFFCKYPRQDLNL
jgi:hypothetical protein